MSFVNSQTFDLKVTVTESDLDELQHVNNVVYLAWVQEVAKKHWQSVTSEQQRLDFIWVALRHEIDYLAPARLGDELRLVTYVEAFKGPISIRCVDIYHQDRTLVKAKTKWCLVDGHFRPKRVPDTLAALF